MARYGRGRAERGETEEQKRQRVNDAIQDEIAHAHWTAGAILASVDPNTLEPSDRIAYAQAAALVALTSALDTHARELSRLLMSDQEERVGNQLGTLVGELRSIRQIVADIRAEGLPGD